MLKFRGSMPAPKYEHGHTIERGGVALGVVQHRKWTGHCWEYGLLSPNSTLIRWVNE